MSPLKTLAAATILFNLGFMLLEGFAGAVESSAGKGAGGVRVTVSTILASNQEDAFDPKLASLSKRLKVFKYRSYRLLRENTQQVRLKEQATFEIPGGRSLTVVVEQRSGNQLPSKVRLMEGEKPLLDTTFKFAPGEGLIYAGPPHEGGVLFLSISVGSQ
jgi:hypothetical protein